jgi:glycosyltransferase involved in cell wall biosynthesis
MNVAFVISTRNWGGVKTWMLEFGCGLKSLGHQVYFFTSDQRLVKEAHKRGCSAVKVHFGFDYNPVTIVRFRRLFRQRKIDISVMNIYKELRSAGVAAKSMGIPVIHRVGLAGDIKPCYKTEFVHKQIVAQVLVPCQTMKKELLESIYFMKDQDIKVIHNGKRPLNLPVRPKHDPVRFVISSKLAKSKGHAVLFESLASLKSKGEEDFVLHVFGTGGEKENLKTQASALGIFEDIVFEGFQRDVAEKLGSFDFGVLASYTEGFPNTALEYIAAGLPVIATDVSGTHEVVRDGFNGFLIAENNQTAMELALEKCLLMNEEIYRTYCGNARSTAAEFDINAKVREFEEYLKFMSNRK